MGSYDKSTAARREAKDLADYTDVLGQLPMMKTYTQISLCFPTKDDSRAAVVQHLEAALARLAASFPHLTGQVVHSGGSEGCTALASIEPLDSKIGLIVNDLTRDHPTMAELREKGFPSSMLDGAVLAPRKGLPESYDESDVPAPVFVLQANFVKGGLILTFSGQHNAMDMNGLGQTIRMFSKCSRAEPLTEEEVHNGRLARSDIIPLFGDDWQPGSDLDEFVVKPKPAADVASAAAASPPSITWAYFSFSAANLVKLKAEATAALPKEGSKYISTNDALSAHIWQHVCKSRIPRLAKSHPGTANRDGSPLPRPMSVSFQRAINARPYFSPPLPLGYLGHCVTAATLQLPLVTDAATEPHTKSVVDLPLGVIASLLRTPMDPSSPLCRLGERTRGLATLANRTKDKSTIAYGANLDLTIDSIFSSWAKLDCYRLDFGLGPFTDPIPGVPNGGVHASPSGAADQDQTTGTGMPECVRRPRSAPMESLSYLIPTKRDGTVDALVCLRDEDLDHLKADEGFMRYATFIG